MHNRVCKLLPAVLTLTMASMIAGSAFAQTVVHVAYPFPETWKPIHVALAKAFEGKHPDITIEFDAPYSDYDEATQKILRGAVTGDLPDLAWLGLNRQRIFADKGVAVDIDPFIANEKEWAKQGYTPAMMSLGTVNGKIYGIATGISAPVIYYNPDILKAVGADPDKMPDNWDDIIKIAGEIAKLPNGVASISFPWDSTGNWLFQNLVYSAGGTMLSADEKKVAFDGPAGEFAVTTLSRFVTEAGMKNIDEDAAIQAFVAGKLGLYVGSVGDLKGITESAGDRFQVRVANFPLEKPDGKLVAGGGAGLMFTKDPEVQKAAWEYLKFAGSAEGSSIAVQNTGFMPPNQVAVKEYLEDFYKGHPNSLVATARLPIMTSWYAFPGNNGLKISDVIKNNLSQIVVGSVAPKEGLSTMASAVQALLPN